MNESLDNFAQLQNQLQQARNEISNLRQQLTTLKYEHKKMCKEISTKLVNFKCNNCESSSSEIQPSNSSNKISDSFNYIGIIHTDFPSKRGVPRQPSLCREAVGRLILNTDVYTNPHHALDGLEKFSHMWILFHFHQTESNHIPAKIALPRLNGLKVGVFGTRSPHRPSPIGLSLVKINEISGHIITFNGVDMMDQTPVLDIKPFIPQYDVPNAIPYGYSSGGRSSWLDSSDSIESTEEYYITEHENQPASQNSKSRTLVGQESLRDLAPGASVDEDRRNSLFNDRMVEREAPDGEEEDSVTDTTLNASSQPDSASLQYSNDIRVPRWLDNPVVPTLTVKFRMSSRIQLRQFGTEEEEKKKIIENILSQDPRSVYLRQQQGDSEFVFRIADVYVCCLFNDSQKTVFVNQILLADEYGPMEQISPQT